MVTSKPLQMALSTDLGNALQFRSMSGQEEISRLFEYHIVAVSDDRNIKAASLLGKPIGVSLDQGGGRTRWFHGIAAAFGLDGSDGRQFRYRITMRPWTWLLSRSADIRIFQDQSVPDIVQSVFAEYQGQVKLELQGSYEPRRYCVQYRETDLNFVCRLLEEEGIFFWFVHSAGKHALVLADEAGAHTPMPGFEKVVVRPHDKAVGDKPSIHQWHLQHEVQPGQMVLSDYNFEQPGTSLLTEPTVQRHGHEHDGLEVYDYPGVHATSGRGKHLAGLRMQEAAARHARVTGQGDTPGLAAGNRFTLEEHPRKDQNAAYLVLGTQIDMHLGRYESGGDGSSFLCRFALQPLAEPFRPARVTPKPHVAGPQTAVEIGRAHV